jgi:acyl dehydratase
MTIHIRQLPDLIRADLGRSSERVITQAQVDLFADATDDHQWTHVDPERMRSGSFGPPKPVRGLG